MLRSLAAIGFAVTAAAIAYELIAATRLATTRKRAAAAATSLPAITVLKPVAGDEAGLFENLSSFVDQAYPEFQVVFGVSHRSDPAIPVIKRVIARFPNADLALSVGDEPASGNPKVANLAPMLKRAKHDLFAIADADMRVDPSYLSAIASAFDDQNVGAVTCLYCGEPSDGFASTLGAMYINEQFTPSVLVANLVEPLTYCFGSTMAVRRAVLEEIGGLDALRAHIGDDYLLGKLVSERGYVVALSPYVVRNVVHEPDVRSLLKHELRWARTIRAQRPTGYASLFITQPVLCALLLLAVSGGSAPAWSAMLAAVAARCAVSESAHRAFGTLRVPPWTLLLRDALTAGVWIGGFFSREVRWRDRDYSVGQDGSFISRQPR